MRNLIKGLFSLLLIAAVFACKENSFEKMRERELEILDAYIETNYPGAEPTRSGLYYFELEEGEQDTIKAGDKVQIFYATWTIDSTLVDETNGYLEGYRYEPFEFIVGSEGVIQGLNEGITYMSTGAKSSMVINSGLAYGQNGDPGVIPGFTTILMEVEVYKVYPLEVPQ